MDIHCEASSLAVVPLPVRFRLCVGDDFPVRVVMVCNFLLGLPQPFWGGGAVVDVGCNVHTIGDLIAELVVFCS
jgi:hypothetical protein